MIYTNFEDIPKDKYRVVLSDCPWAFTTYSNKGKEKAPDAHYGTMTLEDICNLPVNDVTLKDSVHYEWIYNPMLPQGLQVMNRWGFEYKTLAFNWRKLTKTGKDAFGLGYYTRGGSELCFLGTKGKPGRPKRPWNVRQVISEPLREHSRKPDCIYEHIEAMYDGPYLELFARTERPGWDSFGNEVGKFEEPIT
jgi:N6-adenosine-specific RNA methylase IME4